MLPLRDPSEKLSTPRRQTKLALRLRRLSIDHWGKGNALTFLGRHETFREAQKTLLKFSKIDRPILISGETGVGKELFARSLYLLCARKGRPFLSVNCAQYQDSELLASELFGHKKGSFTGASSDHKGLFEEAHGGVIFLDEMGELSPKAQAMLLRAISENEIVRVGESHPRPVDVRVVAATNRDVEHLASVGKFRIDLFYRLCYLHLRVPPLRERGEDWKIIAEHHLAKLGQKRDEEKKDLSEDAVTLLSTYSWPGNVRELLALIDMGTSLCDGPLIELFHFGSRLDSARALANSNGSISNGADARVRECYAVMERGEGDFWEIVRQPYLDRELNRAQAKSIVQKGLKEANGSYKRLLDIFCITQDDYLKFMDFLRHHRLKPEKQ